MAALATRQPENVSVPGFSGVPWMSADACGGMASSRPHCLGATWYLLTRTCRYRALIIIGYQHSALLPSRRVHVVMSLSLVVLLPMFMACG